MPKHYSDDYEFLTGFVPGDEPEPAADDEEYESRLFAVEVPEEPKRARRASKTTEQE